MRSRWIGAATPSQASLAPIPSARSLAGFFIEQRFGADAKARMGELVAALRRSLHTRSAILTG